MEDKKYTYEDLLDIINELRGENGCPWDKIQTHTSLLPHLLEESYELVDAINNQDMPNIKEELGDVLLQVLLHAQIGKECGEFSMEEVVDHLAKKLVYRHPHVFKGVNGIDTPQKVNISWDELKKYEKKERTVTESIERIAKALPALIRSQKIQKKGEKAGLFLEDHLTILTRIAEELEGIRKVEENGNKVQIEEKIGELLFSVVKLSTFFDLNPEFALTKSVEKFINRFRYVENSAFVQGKQLVNLSLDEMNKLWEAYKIIE